LLKKFKKLKSNHIKMILEKKCECCENILHNKVAMKRGFNLYRCNSCGLIFVWPQPSEKVFLSLYSSSDGYYLDTPADLSLTSSARADVVDKLLRSAGIKKGSFLDVGCASGALIFHLKEKGWDVSGIEINSGAVQIAQKNNLQVIEKKFQNHPYENGTFDVIHMGDVIEHCDSPNQVLSIAHALLKKSGALILRTPNADCSFAQRSLPVAKFLRLPWPHSEAPYHLFDFTVNSLRILLEKHGFEISHIDCERTSRFAYIIGGMGYFDEMKRRIKKNYQKKYSLSTLRYAPRIILLSTIFAPIFFAGKITDKYNKKGNVINILAKRL